MRALLTLRARLAACATVVVLAHPAGAQWLIQPTQDLPRLADGRPDLAAAAPRAADGRVDLSGIWQTAPTGEPRPELQGVDGRLRSFAYIDVLYRQEERPYQPWAEAVYRQRKARNLVDDPVARCLPGGVPAATAYPLPLKIVQTPGLLLILYERNAMFRQIFLDGRALPADPQPAWLGYSVGRWEDDTLVVESTGFNDRTWLDHIGNPHTELMRVVERFSRPSLGRIDIEITIDDPGAYTRPFTFALPLSLLPDTELMENICLENEKSSEHFVAP